MSTVCTAGRRANNPSFKTPSYKGKITLTPKQTSGLIHALATALEIKNCHTNPKGTFDNAKRFTLHFRCPYCAGIRRPSHSWPYSQLNHGRTLKHQYHETGANAIVSSEFFYQLARRSAAAARRYNGPSAFRQGIRCTLCVEPPLNLQLDEEVLEEFAAPLVAEAL